MHPSFNANITYTTNRKSHAGNTSMAFSQILQVLAVGTNTWFIFIVFIYEKAVDEWEGVNHQYP
jgi:hypothetical protein